MDAGGRRPTAVASGLGGQRAPRDGEFSKHIFEPEKVRASNVAEDAVLNEGRVDEVLHFPVLLRKERPVHPRPNVVRGVVPVVEEQKVEHSSSEIAAVVVLACRIASVMLQHVEGQDAHFSGQGWEDVHDQSSPPVHPEEEEQEAVVGGGLRKVLRVKLASPLRLHVLPLVAHDVRYDGRDDGLCCQRCRKPFNSQYYSF